MSLESVKLNRQQRLYVIPSGKGYSCLGFDVCHERSEKLSQWLQSHGVTPPQQRKRGSLKAYQRYQELLSLAKSVCDAKRIRCGINLTPQLTGYEGKRIEVVDAHGERRRFIVGKSTGWLPIHLEVSRRNSLGGVGVMGVPFKSIRVVS